MNEKDGEVDRSISPVHDDPPGGGWGHDPCANDGSFSRLDLSGRAEANDKELDEFGLPIARFVVHSRPSSSHSDSFESARSSIDQTHAPKETLSKSHDEDDNADIEDNGTEDHSSGQDNSAIEWPRSSRSNLPSTGHVRSSPFHGEPERAGEKTTKYAERAKDLMETLPVSNSIFKRQEPPMDGSHTPTPTSNTIPQTSNESTSKSPASSSPLQSRLSEELSAIATPEIPPLEEKDSSREKPPKVKISTDVSHSRNLSTASTQGSKSATVIFEDPDESAHNPSGASEWSHQLGVTQTQAHGSPDARKSLDDDGWQTMEAFATYDIYSDDGRLLAKQFQISDDEEQVRGGAGKGYTRMNQDEDVDSADSMDENTQYLFTESLDDENATTPLSQMQATKELLTEGQRIAYVGLCKLTMVSMLRDLGRVRSKENMAAYESMSLWSQKMMIRLFGHMDISSDEQVMIEQLAEHGVIPADLIPSLMIDVEVANPLASYPSGSDLASPSSERFIRSDSSSVTSSTESNASGPPPILSPSALTSKNITLDLRWTILCDLFLVLIADSIYDSRSRVLLEHMGSHLNVNWLDITRFERRVTDALQIQEAGEQNWKEAGLLESREKQARNRRYLMMGLATLGGGLVIGLSAGLLAPVIGAGLGAAFTTIGITGTTGFLAGTGGAALITTGGVVTGGSIAVKGMAKRTKSVETFEFRPLHNNQRVNLLVTVSGWMSSKEDDVRLPFSTIDPVIGDVISLLWEPEILQSMGQTMNLLATEILTQSLQQILGQTVLVALMSSIQWPVMLTKLSYLIDNPWSTSLDRASACGLLLADCLINRHLGQRPISLAGYSLGARVIYYCLLELARAKAYGLIQDVYLFGAPVIIKKKECLRAKSIVAGRFVNGYKSNDWILGYLFRATSTGLGRVAGLRPIENCGDIENLDCTEIVGGHLLYRNEMPKLMKEAGFLVVSEEFSEMEDPDPDKHRERQIALYDEIEEAKKLVAQEEAEALKTGKKIKRARKTGFLGLWGKEIQTKPSGYKEGRKVSAASGSTEKGYYDSSEAGRTNGDVKSDKSRPTSRMSSQNDDTVLFDVDKMREELAANGITMTNLESTLPPLVVPNPKFSPPVHRSVTMPVTAPTSRTHSPSLPAASRNRLSTGTLDEMREIVPRDVTPKKELDKLVVDTKKMPSESNLLSPKSLWDDGTKEGITMSFEPESPKSPKFPRHSTWNEQNTCPSYSKSSQTLEEKPGRKPVSSIVSMPLEKNVWEDDDYGSGGGNITMSFE